LLDQYVVTQGMMQKMYEFKKQNKTMPNDMDGLLKMVKDSGGFPKQVNEVLKKKR